MSELNLPAAADPEVTRFITLESGKSEITPQAIRNSILGLEQMMLAQPAEAKLCLETQHDFAPGVYVRTVLMGKGSLITGKIHKQEHIVIISKGSASVVSEEFGAKKLTAPMIFISPPGVKRLLFIHEDMVFTTVHQNPTNTRDIAALEAEIIAPTYEDLEVKP